MVQALHAVGLRLGMDVVYNHTSASGQAPKSVLDRIVPGYYQRLDAAGAVAHSTCCENTATEHRMMARLMIDTAVVWARHHGIDSFRFDLMGHQPRAAMETLRRSVEAATGRRVDLIGEGWNFGEVADGRRFVQASQLSLNGSGIATFSDRARDAVRGGGASDNGINQILNQGYINGLFYDPNGQAEGRATREDLLRAADMVRVGLAGSLRGYVMQTASGESLPLEGLAYGGNQPAGYASQPTEVVNYVENHDNQTLFDSNVFKLPRATSREDRARVQHLGSAIVAFSQGIAYFHAGQELLRSKSMDRNSFDSGDHFNRLDFLLSDNGFGVGLPPEAGNGESWPLMQPLLADAVSIKPADDLIRWTRDAFVDLLRIRASSSLFRLRTSAEVQARLRFHNVGPAQEPTVLVGQLDGRGHAGAGFSELVYLINVDKLAHTLDFDALKDKTYRLHPVHRNGAAADLRAAQAGYLPATGTFTVPARSAVVFVMP
jgi:pullulanase-type alpha-1,6-glucosidase